MQSYYAMGVAQYKVAEDHLFASLKGAVRSQIHTSSHFRSTQHMCNLPQQYPVAPSLTRLTLADGVEMALANPNATTAVLTGLALVVLPGDAMCC